MADPSPLHDDDPTATAAGDDGSNVENLTAEQYEASYDDAGASVHPVAPPEVLAALGVATGTEDGS